MYSNIPTPLLACEVKHAANRFRVKQENHSPSLTVTGKVNCGSIEESK